MSRSDGRARPWQVLLAFAFVAGVSQMLWLNFAPLLSLVQARYGVSELLASTLVLVFPLLYVVLSLPAGAWVDRFGYKRVVAGGAVLQAVCACMRIADEHFAFLLAGQVGVAIAQPFIVNGISKLVSDWFDEGHAAVATGIGTIGMFLGMAFAMAATPVLVDAFSLSGAMAVFAAISVAAALAFVWLAEERDGGDLQNSPVGFRQMVGRDLVLVFAMAFLGLGYFNGLTTWLELIVAQNGIDSMRAGVLGGVLMLSGIVGAAVVPALSDRLERRKPFVIGCALGALVTTWPLCNGSDYPSLLALAALLGFSFLPAYALLFEMCVELSGKRCAGFATGVLMLLGNAGGVVVIVAMQLVKADAERFDAAVLLLLAILGAAIALAVGVRETFHGRHVATLPGPALPRTVQIGARSAPRTPSLR